MVASSFMGRALWALAIVALALAADDGAGLGELEQLGDAGGLADAENAFGSGGWASTPGNTHERARCWACGSLHSAF